MAWREQSEVWDGGGDGGGDGVSPCEILVFKATSQPAAVFRTPMEVHELH